MKTGNKIEHINDVGKYLVDVSKLIAGGAVLAPMFKGSDYHVLSLIMWGLVTTATLAMGIVFKNVKA